MPGGCQHPVTGCVVAKAVDMEKVGREGVRGKEGSRELEESHFRQTRVFRGWMGVGLRNGGDWILQ